LIEEVALRRMVLLQAARGDAVLFLKASEQYARRFIRSPYAAQFADAFVAGATDMAETITVESVASVLNTLPADRRNALYLRLTRQAVIAGRLGMAAFAAAEALRDGRLAKDRRRGAQAALYSVIPELTKGDASQLKARLGAIDAARLPENDLALLKATQQIVEAIAQPFEVVEPSTRSAEAQVRAPEAGEPQKSSTFTQADSVDSMIAASREKLAAVDTLLESVR
jgi:chemotaxis protein MotC